VKHPNRGFTLVEVMVALAIFALLASTIATSNIQALNSARQIEEQVQARWINQNVLTQMRLDKALPDGGTTRQNYSYNNQDWIVEIEVSNVEMDLLGPFLRHIKLRTRLKTDDTPADILIAVLGEAGSP